MGNADLKILVLAEILLVVVILVVKGICYLVKEHKEKKAMNRIFEEVRKIIKEYNKED